MEQSNIAEILYNIAALQILPGMTLGLSICFFFVYVPRNEILRNYRISRKLLGCAYLAYSIALMVESVLVPHSVSLTGGISVKVISLVVSSLQAFMFTSTLITLIDPPFITRKRVFEEALLVVSFIVGAIIVSALFSERVLTLFFHFYVVFYLFLLARYVLLFRRRYALFREKMDNYYSGTDYFLSKRVTFWFYASFAIGLMGLAYSLYYTFWSSMFFLPIFSLFYIVFGINFLNYPKEFLSVEAAMESKESDSQQQEREIEPDEKDIMIMAQIESLMIEQKSYKNPDISIADLAVMVGVTPKQISTASNRCKKENFKSYISALRVEEAKKMIKNNAVANLTMDAIGFSAGFASKTNFYRIF